MLDGVESFDVAQALHPFHAHPLTIEVAVEAEQVDLQNAPPILEGRPGSLIHHPTGTTTPPFDFDGVDAVRRQQLPRRHLAQVDGRDAQQASATFSLPYLADDAVGPTQHGPGASQVSPGNRAPNA